MSEKYQEKNQKFVERALKISKKLPIASVYPLNDEALKGAILAHEMNLVDPIIIGPKKELEKIAKNINKDLSQYEVIDVLDMKEAAKKAVELVKENRAKAILKGSLDTSILLKAVLSKDTGIRANRRISNCYICDTPFYKKTLIYTDVGINILPNLKTKVDILLNAIDVARSIGIEKPKIAILSCIEKVNEEIISTMDAKALVDMAKEGIFKDVILEGPLSFDIAFSKKIADDKNFPSKVAGDVDIALFPNLDASNIAVKQLELFSKAECGSLALGAKVPVLINSRNTTAKERALSCVFAKLYYENIQNK
ncbi:MAG: Phosphate acetyltransferase [Candidatus Anoxychlamydiales bacterium]|nr:Phosphate acetyltransferase [Candidatus Anoxychlamydiales bacterium]NGX40321.1 Phosphate acetyltransferase [Candidatus Anoxychlamydiales bacterium]